MKKITIPLTVLALSVLLVSCKKFLDVKPENKYTDDQVFSSEINITNTLNGAYMSLSSGSLYGGNLTKTQLEVLAQRYQLTSGPPPHNMQAVSLYKYSENQTYFIQTWSDAYENIMNLNNFIDRLESSPNVVNPTKTKILLGEAHGLRAFLHFDMLRMYGPVYKLDSNRLSIPYNTHATGNVTPLLPARVVMDSVLNDLAIAAQLLVDDQIRTKGCQLSFEGDGYDFYYRYRNRRLNYYAVKALQARVLLYRGSQEAAYNIAKPLIDELDPWFAWTTKAEVNNLLSPDCIFSKEVLFGVRDENMYKTTETNFAKGLENTNVLAMNYKRAKLEYDTANDYRFNMGSTITNTIVGSSWVLNSDWNASVVSEKKPFYNFCKYNDVAKTVSFRFFQPLLRKSELYYIVAECAPTATEGIEYLNRVRRNRGLTDLLATANLTNEVASEYRKEFAGEGQLFFFYKRINKPTLISGNSDFMTPTISMNGGKNYEIPIPIAEQENQ